MSYERGIDVSHWEPVVVWQEVVQSGYTFAFMKASQGTLPDTSFAGFWQDARGVIRRGPYHFYDPRYATISPRRQAEYFWSRIEHDPGELTPVVDIELYESGPYHGSSYWYEFIQRFKELYGKYPMIYTAYYYWMENVKVSPVQDEGWFARNCELWVANYRVEVPLVPKPWTDWTYWQYSETGTVPGVYNERGQLTECDLNFYKGGEAPNPPEDIMLSGKVLVTLNIRSTPDASIPSNVIGKLYAGDLVEASSKANGWWKLTRIVRNGVSLILPASECYAYEGLNQGYIQTIATLPSDEYILHVKDGVTRKFVPES